MWSSELDNIMQKIEEGKKKNLAYIEEIANKVASNIIKYLIKHKKRVLRLLEENSGELRSENIYQSSDDYDDNGNYEFYNDDNYGCVESTKFQSEIGNKASKIVSEEMGIKCSVCISYDYDLRKSHEDRVEFTLYYE